MRLILTFRDCVPDRWRRDCMSMESETFLWRALPLGPSISELRSSPPSDEYGQSRQVEQWHDSDHCTLTASSIVRSFHNDLPTALTISTSIRPLPVGSMQMQYCVVNRIIGNARHLRITHSPSFEGVVPSANASDVNPKPDDWYQIMV